MILQGKKLCHMTSKFIRQEERGNYDLHVLLKDAGIVNGLIYI